tara:strand:+ start:302 stop:781 length:480 start_codon:yes stop_codon:yes gene_type:complete
MIKGNWVVSTIFGIIVLNIFILVDIFIIPRSQYIIDHWKWQSEDLMETSGPMDMPNQYPMTYKVANEIRNVTEENTIILMPTDNWEFGSNRSVVIQRLYPRKVYFLGDNELLGDNQNLDSNKLAYAVELKENSAELCFNKDAKSLGNTGFVICESSFFN